MPPSTWKTDLELQQSRVDGGTHILPLNRSGVMPIPSADAVYAYQELLTTVNNPFKYVAAQLK
ncbi:hypothetical protein [Mycobacterium sp. OTB74]|jgi:hypothetical protein|uniref:hypothetical protein n=1 Tax=Mycobacterium sp. OTB74 TaxID=1853452 RepID=UPI0024752FCC|nr:hypothetical protein [Mycobacterium sp. OTB74]MDH6245681.1 hypothetical protein [Mycobacterium sp. OTB74]